MMTTTSTHVALLILLLSVSASSEDLPSVQINIVKESPCSEGEGAAGGDYLQVHYVGKLDNEDGDEFDSSRKRGKTFNFQLGAGQVIKKKITSLKETNFRKPQIA